MNSTRVPANTTPGELFIAESNPRYTLLRRNHYKSDGTRSHCDFFRTCRTRAEALSVMAEDQPTIAWRKGLLRTPAMLGRALYEAASLNHEVAWEDLEQEPQDWYIQVAVRFTKAIGVTVQDDPHDSPAPAPASQSAR